jgi:Putative MetA-pathway of phenol degradation
MKRIFATLALGIMLTPGGTAWAHGPVFSPGPETIWKGGTQVTVGTPYARQSGAGAKREEFNPFFEVEYGLTENWEIGIEVPYKFLDLNGPDADGIGDVTLDTKYQFWKKDLPGAQYKAATFAKLKLPTASDTGTPRLGSGSTDFASGIAAGYESRRWYWFTSAVYRFNGEGGGGLEKGDRQFLNAVGGIRPVLSEYNEPDTVLMLELNWERSDRDKLNGLNLANTGGWELFLSPVFWWTYRQIAVKGGVQLPILQKLNGKQPDTDYRGKLEFVYHF